MTVELEILNPLELDDWDELLLTNENYSFFHTSAWATVLHESYQYKPLYFTSIENGELLVLVPLMEIRSPLTGRRGVSLPFTDYCQPILPDAINGQGIIDGVIDYAKRSRWKYIEWRGGESYFQNMTPSTSYYGHTLDIAGNKDELLNSFRDSTKRNIRKADREGVRVRILGSVESIKAFYRLNCITRKHHGLPPQPFFFFKKVFEHIISRDLGIIALASHSEKVIAGAVYYHFGGKAIYKYGASDRSYQYLRPNNLVMWEAIKWYAANGFKSLCFGRTEQKNAGLLQFKRGWGAREKVIRYYKFDFKKESFVRDHPPYQTYSNLFQKTPVPLLKLAGSVIYRHFG